MRRMHSIRETNAVTERSSLRQDIFWIVGMTEEIWRSQYDAEKPQVTS